ncbi:MAG: hypothetical protein ACJAZ8_000970 [Planctomycetota bacterium]|jgi:hypothetical protein
MGNLKNESPGDAQTKVPGSQSPSQNRPPPPKWPPNPHSPPPSESLRPLQRRLGQQQGGGIPRGWPPKRSRHPNPSGRPGSGTLLLTETPDAQPPHPSEAPPTKPSTTPKPSAAPIAQRSAPTTSPPSAGKKPAQRPHPFSNEAQRAKSNPNRRFDQHSPSQSSPPTQEPLNCCPCRTPPYSKSTRNEARA